MVHHAAAHSLYSLRERAPTVPYDLTEYARSETGPSSWSAANDSFSAWVHDHDDDGLCARTTQLLVSIAPTDVPRVCGNPELLVQRLSLREAFVLASIDGESTLDTLLPMLDMPPGEALTIVCELCAAGVIALV